MFMFYSFFNSQRKFHYCDSFSNFHIIFSRWFLIMVWVRVSLLKSPGLFSVFWLISIMLQSRWAPLVLLFPSPPIPLLILWWLHRDHRLKLVQPSLSCSIVICKFFTLVLTDVFFPGVLVIASFSNLENTLKSSNWHLSGSQTFQLIGKSCYFFSFSPTFTFTLI